MGSNIELAIILTVMVAGTVWAVVVIERMIKKLDEQYQAEKFLATKAAMEMQRDYAIKGAGARPIAWPHGYPRMKEKPGARMMVCPGIGCPRKDCPHRSEHPESVGCEVACLYMSKCEPKDAAVMKDVATGEHGKQKDAIVAGVSEDDAGGAPLRVGSDL